jgi:hypothetical protein
LVDYALHDLEYSRRKELELWIRTTPMSKDAPNQCVVGIVGDERNMARGNLIKKTSWRWV